MGRRHSVRPATLAASLGLLLCGRAALATDMFPLEDLRPGMTGVGRTVFEGSRIDEFKVTILGILENALGAKQSIILARLEGGPLEKTGVIAGMSGSPVFIDGKLVGAVAYSFPFAKETIGGITPIGSMIEATNNDAPRAASARFASSPSGRRPGSPLDREAMVAALQRPLRAVVPGAGDWRGGSLPTPSSGTVLTPLALPLVFWGFDPATFDWARGVFSGLGFTPVLGRAEVRDRPSRSPSSSRAPPSGSHSSKATSTSRSPAPSPTSTRTGSTPSATPSTTSGPTQFPMKKAYVYSVFPSL